MSHANNRKIPALSPPASREPLRLGQSVKYL